MALASSGALAQEEGGLGLDLTDTPPKKEEPKKEEPKKEAPPPDASKTADTAPAKNNGPAVERDTTQDDRVKSVQKKLYLKRYRFELAPYFMVSLNDPYYTKFGGTIRAAFHLSDTLALSARAGLMKVVGNEDVRVAKRVFSAVVYRSIPIWWVMGDFEWSPFYGKVAFMNTIIHLDGFVTAGAGAVATETAGLKPAFDIGGGLRFVVRDWVAVNAALINTTYVEAPSGTTHASTQNALMVMVGLSIFIPFKSTFREAE